MWVIRSGRGRREGEGVSKHRGEVKCCKGEEEARTNMAESGTQWPGQLLALANSASEGALCLTGQSMTATHEVCAQC